MLALFKICGIIQKRFFQLVVAVAQFMEFGGALIGAEKDDVVTRTSGKLHSFMGKNRHLTV